MFQKVKKQLSKVKEISSAENVKNPTSVCDLVNNLFQGAHHHQVVLILFLSSSPTWLMLSMVEVSFVTEGMNRYDSHVFLSCTAIYLCGSASAGWGVK